MIVSTDPSNERALLGAILLDPSAIAHVATEVSFFDFSDNDFGLLYDALVTLHDAGVPINDLRVLVPRLKAMNLIGPTFDQVDLGKLTQGTFGHHAKFYALEVRKASRLRQQERIAHELLRHVSANDADPDRVATWLDCAAQSFTSQTGRCRSIGEIAKGIVEDLRKPRENRRPVMTGLIDIDETVGGFCAGELIVLAARPGQGKSAFAAQVAMHVASHRGAVAYFTLEMSEEEVCARVLFERADVNGQLLRNSCVNDEQIARIDAACSEISGVPLYVDETPSATTTHIRAVAKQVAARSPLGLVVVDYISLVKHPSAKMAMWERIADLTRDLKAIAKDLSVPVLALCQLNRESEDCGEPRLSHLRYGGSVEQDADVVLFLSTDSKAGTAKLNVAKHRHAETGNVILRWVPERTRFESYIPTGYEPLP